MVKGFNTGPVAGLKNCVPNIAAAPYRTLWSVTHGGLSGPQEPHRRLFMPYQDKIFGTD